MSTPDAAAAALHWRGAPLPEQGATLRVTHTRSNGRSFTTKTDTAKVVTVSLAGDVLTINNTMRLDATRLTDKWVLLLAPSAADRAITLAPVPDPATSEDDTAAEPIARTPDGAPDPNPTTLAGKQRRWSYCKRQAQAADALSKVLKAERDTLEQEIIDECVEQGLTAPLQIDNVTYSFAPEYQVAYNTNDDGEKYSANDVIEALRACGLDTGLVAESYNGNSLRGMLRERDEQKLEMPEELAKVLTLKKQSGVREVPAAAAKRAGANALHTRGK